MPAAEFVCVRGLSKGNYLLNCNRISPSQRLLDADLNCPLGETE